jgi:hypothetical protein
METELRETYRALKECTDGLKKIFQIYNIGKKSGAPEKIKETQKEYLLKLTASIDAVSEAIDIHSTNPDYKHWLNLIRDLIAPHLANLANVPIIASHPNDVKTAQKVGGLHSINNGTITPDGQLHFIYFALSTLMDYINAATQANEPELPPIDASLKSAAHYVVLLKELGILKHLKDKYNLPAKRLGELCEFITGHKTDYFREAFGHYDPETCRAFTDTSRREVASQLKKWGIETNTKKVKK